MPQAIKAGGLYAALAFAAGFVLGSLRVVLVAPRLGELAAVALELPLMLAVSWFACGAVLRQAPLATRLQRLTMGAVAFALLLAAETLLSVALGRSPDQILESYGGLPGQLGLLGQLVFAAFPLIRR